MNTTRSQASGFAVLWAVLFAAVIAHLPSVGFDFVQDDFTRLARASGIGELDTWAPRPLTSYWVWAVQWKLFGTAPTFLHGLAALLAGGIAVMTARVGLRLGLGIEGAAIAGFALCAGVRSDLPTAWVSASAELWAVLFALIAIELWLDRRGGARVLLAALAAVLSALSKEPALGLFLLLPLAQRWFGPHDLTTAAKRGRSLMLAVIGLSALAAATMVWRQFQGASATDAYALGFGLQTAENLLMQLGWAAAPSGMAAGTMLFSLGAIVLGLWVGAVWTGHRRGDRLPLFALILALAGLLPTIGLEKHQYAYYALIAAVGWAWILGWLLGPLVRSLRTSARAPQWLSGLMVAVGLVVFGIGGAALRHQALWATDAAGKLEEPILQRAVQVPSMRRMLASAVERVRPDGVIVLQATRAAIPEEILQEHAEVLVRSQALATLSGSDGLHLLTGKMHGAKWTTTLDDIPLDSFVLIDAGGERLHPLGPPENARIYSALIGVAAGQFDRARHDFWWVINLQGTEVMFAFDPDGLPISPDELDAEAGNFANWLRLDGSAQALRILKLFGQVYEAVRGEELLQEGFGPTLRSGRM